MSALFNGSGQSLSAILSNPPVEGQNRLITTWVRPVGESFGSENWIFYLCTEDRVIYQALHSTSTGMWTAPGRYASSGTPGPYNNAYTHDEDRWYLVGNFMEGHNGITQSLLELMVDGDFVGDWNVPIGTPSGREYTRLYVGANDVSSFGRWRGYIAELAIWIVDDRAHALAICDELLTKKPNAVSVATPHYYLPLESDVVPLIGAPAMTITGSVTLHDDVHPSLAAGSPPDAPTIGAVSALTHNSVTINWTDNSDDEDGFKVEYGESSGGTVSSWSEASNSPTAADAESLNLTGLDPETTYKARVAATNAIGDSSWVETAEFTTDQTPDTTAPTLTNPTATATGQTTASGSVTTDEGNGTLYYLASANSTESAATVKGGDSQAVSATGVQNVGVTGLTHSTTYYLHFVHVDAADNESDVASSSQFTTDSPPPPATKGVRVQLSAGAENLTGLSVRWWDDPTATGAPDYETDVEATDASGWLEIDLDAVTANEVDEPGALLVFKSGANPGDWLRAFGPVSVVDIGE